MLSFEGVTKEFNLAGCDPLVPVRDVTLSIESGEIVVIFGRSGTGKTTLLNLGAGLVRPTSGVVKISDQDVSKMSDKQVSGLRSRVMGFVFQFPSLLPALTVQDNVALPAIFTGRDGEAAGRAEELLGKVGLSGRKNAYPKQLSAGEQKRAVIARALINEPQLVLADEPTSDLDCNTEAEIMSLLADINKKGVTFLIVTHNLDLRSFATRAFEMDQGNLVQVK